MSTRSNLDFEFPTQIEFPRFWVVYQRMGITREQDFRIVDKISMVGNLERLPNIVIRNEYTDTPVF